jgi:hypothetical protein
MIEDTGDGYSNLIVMTTIKIGKLHVTLMDLQLYRIKLSTTNHFETNIEIKEMVQSQSIKMY